MTNQKPANTQKNAENPAVPGAAEADGKPATSRQRQKAEEKTAGGTNQALKAPLKAGKNGKPDRSQKQVESNRAQAHLPAQKKTAKSNGKGLQGYGNAQKGEGDRNERQGGNQRREERRNGQINGSEFLHVGILLQNDCDYGCKEWHESDAFCLAASQTFWATFM